MPAYPLAMWSKAKEGSRAAGVHAGGKQVHMEVRHVTDSQGMPAGNQKPRSSSKRTRDKDQASAEQGKKAKQRSVSKKLPNEASLNAAGKAAAAQAAGSADAAVTVLDDVDDDFA